MTYNFDEVIERRGTDSVKWDGVKSVWGRDDLLPMWVADMDFRTPPFVMEALRKRLHQSRRPGNGDDSRLSSLLPGDATHEARSGLLSARPERWTVSD